MINDFLDTAPCFFFSFNDDSFITHVNKTLLEQLGYKKEDLIGKRVEHLFNLASKIFYQTYLFPLLKVEGKANEVFLHLITKNNKNIPVVINTSRAKTGDIFVNNVFAITIFEHSKYENDILTAKKEAEDNKYKNTELIKARKMLEEKYIELDRTISDLKSKNQELMRLNAVFTHELQEPLRKILMYSDVLKTNLPETGNTSFYAIAEKLSKSSEKVSLIIGELQSFLEISLAQKKYAETNIKELLARQIEFFKHQYKPDFSLDGFNENFILNGNEKQLNLLFFHLLENAIVHNTSKNKKIEVELISVHENIFKHADKYKYEEFVRISIKDNGPGIDASYHDYIFESLRRLENTNRLGLGLAICKKIAENHDGFIRLKSKPGAGSVFEVFLPSITRQV